MDHYFMVVKYRWMNEMDRHGLCDLPLFYSALNEMSLMTSQLLQQKINISMGFWSIEIGRTSWNIAPSSSSAYVLLPVLFLFCCIISFSSTMISQEPHDILPAFLQRLTKTPSFSSSVDAKTISLDLIRCTNSSESKQHVRLGKVVVSVKEL